MICYSAVDEKILARAAIEGGGVDFLLSFFDQHRNIFRFFWQEVSMLERPRFFLDSGAFSAWSRGAIVDLDEYAAFVRTNIEHLEGYANLDVIPGKPGQVATPAQKEVAAQQSWANLEYLRREGLDPVPVFHVGERFYWLERMCESCSYIGLGGMVGINREQRRLWLDDVWDKLTNEDGSPKIRVHGFGMTAVALIFRYPWYSVDSTSWIKATANGAVLFPALKDGAFTFDEPPVVVSVSNQSPNAAEDGKHANSFGPNMRGVFESWLSECGVTYAQVEESYYHRAVCNVRFFVKVGQMKGERRFQRPEHKRVSLW